MFLDMLDQNTLQRLVSKRRQALKRWRHLPSYQRRRQARRQIRQFQQQLRRRRYAILRRQRQAKRHKIA